MPGQIQCTTTSFLAVKPGIHEITGLRVVEIPTIDTPGGGLVVSLSSCPAIVVHGERY